MTVVGGLVFAHPDSSSHTCISHAVGGPGALHSWVGLAGGRRGVDRD